MGTTAMAGRVTFWLATAVAVLLFPITVVSIVTTYPNHKCATTAPPQDALVLNSTTLSVGQRPWGLAYLSPDVAFVAANLSLGVLDTSVDPPTLTSLIPLPAEFLIGNDDAFEDGYGYRELSFTNDKQNVYIATGYGAVILDVQKAIAGSNDSVVGVLSRDGYVGRSAIELSITPDDKYVFISQEFGSNVTGTRGAVEVYEVTRLENGTVIGSWKGYITLDYGTIGQQFSKDYTKLYVTSELYNAPSNNSDTIGTISVLDVETLKRTPAKSLIAKVVGGCRPVRCRVSPDGNYLWVTERDNNELSLYDMQKLANNDTAGVLLATVDTGTSPIGIAVAGNYVFTADSNRFYYPNATTGLTIINSTAVLENKQKTFPQLRTGAFPRSIAVSPDGNSLLVSEYGTGIVRVVNVSSLHT